MEHFSYTTSGTCSRQIDFDMENGVLHNVVFTGGCDGNLKAIAKLVEGKKAADVMDLLSGNTCGDKATSCGDQLSRACKKALGA